MIFHFYGARVELDLSFDKAVVGRWVNLLEEIRGEIMRNVLREGSKAGIKSRVARADNLKYCTNDCNGKRASR